MERFIAIILLTSYLGNNIAATNHPKKCAVVCEPNKSFLDADGCNTCRCEKDGIVAACTLMACGEKKPVPLDKRPCTPGTTFVAGCCKCKCSNDGHVKSCKRKRRSGKCCPVRQCKPGDTKKVDCNTCYCTAPGKWSCTEIACCDPGTTVAINCNTCSCEPDGTVGICTQHTCPIIVP